MYITQFYPHDGTTNTHTFATKAAEVEVGEQAHNPAA